MARDLAELREIRDELRRLFIEPARNGGQVGVANAIAAVLPLLNLYNVERKTSVDVTTLSKNAKADAPMGKGKELGIATLYPDFVPKEKSVLEEKAKKGYVGMIVRGLEIVPDELENEIRKAGVDLITGSGEVSLNVTFDSVLLYHIDHPLGPPSSSDRVAIRIFGKAGRTLSEALQKVRNEWLPKEPSPFPRPKGTLKAGRAINEIVRDPRKMEEFKQILRTEDIREDYRITLMLYCLQTKLDKYYSCFELEKELKMKQEDVKKSANILYGRQRYLPFRNFEFDLPNGSMKLTSSAKQTTIPVIFQEALNQAAAVGNGSAKDLMDEYGLPFFGKKKFRKRFFESYR
jgi:hypothetical protein